MGVAEVFPAEGLAPVPLWLPVRCRAQSALEAPPVGQGKTFTLLHFQVNCTLAASLLTQMCCNAGS